MGVKSYNYSMTALGPLTPTLVTKVFPANVDEVKLLLEEQCGQNLPFGQDGTPESLQRLRFAALKVSEGNLHKLQEAVSLAKIDWRDLLVCAEFASNLDAHEIWANNMLG